MNAKTKSTYRLLVVGPDGTPETAEVDITLPRITTIVDKVFAKPGLESWYYKTGIEGFSNLAYKYGSNLPPDLPSLHSLMKSEGLSPYAIRDAAATAGSKIHRTVESLSRGGKPTKPENLVNFWKERGWTKKDIIASEELVVNFKPFPHAGRLDLIYRGEDGNVLTDIKSGDPRKSHEIQLELYRQAWESMGGEEIETMSIITVPRDGSDVTEKLVPVTLELQQAARGVLMVYEWLKGGRA